MDEFIREVDEDYRRERALALWRRYGVLFVALGILFVAGVGGWRYWQSIERGRAEAASTRFDDALRLAREGKSGDSETTLRQLVPDAPPGYALLARFRLAAETGRGDPEGGAASFDALAADPAIDPVLRDLARLRAAMLRMDAAPPEAVSSSLEPLAAGASPWRHTARELLGLASLKRGDFDGAGRWFDQIAADRETPQGLRGRLGLYTALAAGGPVQVTQ